MARTHTSYRDMQRLGGTAKNFTAKRFWWEYAFNATNEGDALNAIAKALKCEGEELTVQLDVKVMERLIAACESKRRFVTATELKKAVEAAG